MSSVTFGILGSHPDRASLLARLSIQNLLAGGAVLRFWIHGAAEAGLPWDLHQPAPIGLPPASSQPVAVDFLLQLDDGPISQELLHLPRRGIWRFSPATHHPLGFWEVFDGLPVVEVRLDRLTLDPALRIPLDRRWLKTERHSYRETVASLIREMAEMPTYVCRTRLERSPEPAPFPPAIHAWPSEMELAAFRCKLAVRNLARQFQGAFFTEAWKVGIIEAPIARFLDPEFRAAPRWLPSPSRDHFLADPFVAAAEGGYLLLAEEFDFSTNLGRIVEEFSPDGRFSGRMRVSVQEDCHMSYPYPLATGGHLYCIPETHQNNGAFAWRRDPATGRWVERRPVLTGFPCIDSTPAFFEDRWWIFCTDRDDGVDSKLHIFHAPDPFGPWTAHAANPVKIDVRSSRPAGTPFVFRDRLYRPAQDCSRHYGFRVVINRVHRLTPTEFEEEPIRVVEAGRWGCNGIHTLAGSGQMTVFDGRYDRFTPWRTPRVLAEKVRRFSGLPR